MILIHPNRITTYLDEIHDEPPQAATLAQTTYNLQFICLRRAWTANVCTMHELAMERLKRELGSLKVLMINSDLGLDKIQYITDAEFEKPFLVANYFGARFLRVHIGGPLEWDLRPAWIKRVGDRAVRASITPLFEYSATYGNMEANQILDLISNHPRWKILYDPAQLVVRRNINPFISYWIPLRDHVALFDLRDFKIGEGFKPVGHGDCKLSETIKDANEHEYKGMYALEPGLGQRYFPATSRDAVFKLAYEQMIEQL